MNRAHCLQEGHRKIHTSFECPYFPLLFIAGEVPDTVAIEHLAKCLPASDLKDHIENSRRKGGTPSCSCQRSKKWRLCPLSLGG